MFNFELKWSVFLYVLRKPTFINKNKLKLFCRCVFTRCVMVVCEFGAQDSCVNVLWSTHYAHDLI